MTAKPWKYLVYNWKANCKAVIPQKNFQFQLVAIKFPCFLLETLKSVISEEANHIKKREQGDITDWIKMWSESQTYDEQVVSELWN